MLYTHIYNKFLFPFLFYSFHCAGGLEPGDITDMAAKFPWRWTSPPCKQCRRRAPPLPRFCVIKRWPRVGWEETCWMGGRWFCKHWKDYKENDKWWCKSMRVEGPNFQLVSKILLNQLWRTWRGYLNSGNLVWEVPPPSKKKILLQEIGV